MKIAADGFELGQGARGVGRVILNFLPLLAGLLPDDEVLAYTKAAAAGSRLPGVSEVVLPWQGGYLGWLNGPLRRALRTDKPDIFLAANYLLPVFFSGTAVLFEHDISAVTHPEWYPRRFAMSRKFLVRPELGKGGGRGRAFGVHAAGDTVSFRYPGRQDQDHRLWRRGVLPSPAPGAHRPLETGKGMGREKAGRISRVDLPAAPRSRARPGGGPIAGRDVRPGRSYRRGKPGRPGPG